MESYRNVDFEYNRGHCHEFIIIGFRNWGWIHENICSMYTLTYTLHKAYKLIELKYTYVHMHSHTYSHIRMYTCTHTHVSTLTYVHMYSHICTHVLTHMYILTHMYTCTHTYVHTHTHDSFNAHKKEEILTYRRGVQVKYLKQQTIMKETRPLYLQEQKVRQIIKMTFENASYFQHL